ncbi:alpha/beta fold hydrolase [Dermacoccus barathri]|uniref:Alpha/beta hydrolase n=1 Tax=Dermacoccus abyssi TaxID=322596 RepID=A0ABX5ZAH2_9MICO|nr:alpha/beta hydrolase [Dermacoccus barathri]MBE7371033.1 alpha/beta hydrolase [Dermacoccus barathri]QEH93617.1 alpha/beta hydrolase [Dermacoccus abyssi]
MSGSVVLVHGVRSSRTMWRPQIKRLTKRGFHVVAPDLPGHGERQDEEFSLAAALATIDEAVASCPEPPMLVGLSLGGYLSLQYAATTQRPLRAVTVAGCTAVPNRFLAVAFGAYLSWRDRLPGNADDSVLAAFAKANSPKAARHYYGGGRAKAHVVAPVMRALGRLDVLEAIGSIDVPVTIINGRGDEFRIHERRFLAANDAARLIVLDDAGHISNLNRPKRFTKELRAAFERAERQRLVVA